MIGSTELPVLEMHPSVALVMHEEWDPLRVKKLEERLLGEKVLKNPPIVAPISGTESLVVLDGANRTAAFQELGIKHIVAQIVSYNDPGIKVESWNHVVSGLDAELLIKTIVNIADIKLEKCSLDDARESLNKGEAIGYLVFENDVCKVLASRVSDIKDLRILNDIVGAYKGKAKIFRASNDEWEKQSPYYPGITALVVFPSYQPDDIMAAVKNGYKIPSGVTRHIIPYRALNINIPLEILQADLSLQEKREWLNDWLMERMAANAIRYYAEPTFSFNE